MAHHQKQNTDASRRGSAMQSLLKMLNLSTAPTVPLGEDEVAADADEPPDDQLAELNSPFHKDPIYNRSPTIPQNRRRESLLTRAILGETKPDEASHSQNGFRGMSTTSSHSAASMASTAELTSDGDLTSPARSATPSPPPPPTRYAQLLASQKTELPTPKIVIAPITKDDKPAVADVGEAAIEKTLGRKRCIMFACGGKSPEPKQTKLVSAEKKVEPEPPKRKCTLTFACPSRQESVPTKTVSPAKARIDPRGLRKPSPAPSSKRRLSTDATANGLKSTTSVEGALQDAAPPKTTLSAQPFHEFGSSHDETEAWVHQSDQHKEKLTISDCMKKENAIRQLGEEAEEEAEEEEREQEELDELLDDNEAEDDFAPSDENNDGNESDDEGGFADSDDESDSDSEYQFWAPSTTTATTSTENINISHFSSRQRSHASSLESNSTPPMSNGKGMSRRRLAKAVARMRPGTPELPDSTDFVCGTLDEDRPLEAAYISCREQKKRMKHIPIPQDVDPTFPTTDPDDNDENEDDDDVSPGAGGPMWMKDQFTGFEEDGRGRFHSSATRISPTPTPPKQDFPVQLMRRPTNRSPPPKRVHARSPPPRKLFGHSPTRLRSPPPRMRLRSPPGSPTQRPMTGFAINNLAQRPRMERTASLPKTPNPFFRNFKIGSPSISNVASGAVTPSVEEPPRFDLHVRGPVDIVIGLEKKRQKRKEKYWRQHCRKVAKEQTERKPVPGRGAERMRELGLECAERNRGYGLAQGQQAQLVISL